MQNIRDPHAAQPHGPATPNFLVRSYVDGHTAELEALLAGATTGGIRLAQRSAGIGELTGAVSH